jgi:hypothetical protein
MRSVIDQFENYAKLNKKLPAETRGAARARSRMRAAGRCGCGAISTSRCRTSRRCSPSSDPLKRLEMVFAFMEGELGVLQVEKKIRGRVKRQMEKTQREYYLNEQLKAIQRELGGGEGEEGRRDGRAAGQDRQAQAVQGSPHQGQCRAEEAQVDAADVCRGDGGAQLSRRAARPALGQEVKLKNDIAAQEMLDAIISRSKRSRTGSSNISRCRRAPTS